MGVPKRVASGLAGLLVSGGAVLLAWGCLHPTASAGEPSRGGAGATVVALAVTPGLAIYGLVAAVRGILFGSPLLARKAVFYTAILMLLVGAFPWVYTDRLIGGRPGNEGAGMLGTLIFLFVGVPGFIAAVTGAIVGWWAEP